jgi:hypothetical protein
MKLKYKKIILLTTMSIMGIGVLTLSVSNDKSKDQKTKTSVQEAFADTQGKEDIVTTVPSITPIITVAPTPLPVYDIEKDAYPDVSNLFKKFYKAKTDRDVDAIKNLLSDPTKVDTQDDLQKKTEYIEEYLNVSTYSKLGFVKGTYIVYVYHEIKFTGITTPAPGLSKFYVITDAEGKLKIFSGEMEEDVKNYYDERNNDEDVVTLIEMTNKKSKEAVKNDEDLQSFWDSINELAEKDSAKAEENSVE